MYIHAHQDLLSSFHNVAMSLPKSQWNVSYCTHLYLQAQVCAALWATEVKCFLHKLDAVTGSTAAPVEALVVAADMGNRTLHSEQVEYVKTVCSAIKDATRNASEG